VEAYTCPYCGFPFVCDITPLDSGRLRARSMTWRTLLGLAAILFMLTSGIYYNGGYYEYQGLTTYVVDTLAPASDAGFTIDGPPVFIMRTNLVLGLIEQRAPDVYWRIQDNITSIEYLGPAYLETEEGRRISLEGIGALAETATGRVRVLYSTAFPSGPAELYDRDVFSYAGVLVHELRHIELHAMDRAPGGWEEEVLCEQAAYAALKQMSAPGGVLVRYETYLDNPRHKRYQHWYDWYKLWE
jgi:hypothetical protein